MKKINKFEELGLDKDIVRVLSEEGFNEPTDIQTKAIPFALKGEDIVGESATGSGKTLAFSSGIIQNVKIGDYPQALILTPTRELANQVASSIKKFSKYHKLNVASVYGGVAINPQIKQIADADIVVATPGRLLDHFSNKSIRLDHIKFLVLDEADRMFDMGFYKDVERIIYSCPKDRQTMLFSATISSEIDYLVKKHTSNPKFVSVKSTVDPSQLKQVYYDIDNSKKFSLLVHLLKNEHSELVMVFCSTRRNVDFVCGNLKRQGIHVQSIHGGLSQNQRNKVLKAFHNKGVNVLVCTDVAARGLDIPNVSHVYNYDLPNASVDYIHRIGRTARAGKNGMAVSLLSSRDYENFERIIRMDKVKINLKETPELKRVSIHVSNDKRRGSFNRGRSNGYSRGSNRSRSSNNRGYSREDSSSGRRNFRRGNQGSRGRNKGYSNRSNRR